MGAVDEMAGVPASPSWLAVQYNNGDGRGGVPDGVDSSFPQLAGGSV